MADEYMNKSVLDYIKSEISVFISPSVWKRPEIGILIKDIPVFFKNNKLICQSSDINGIKLELMKDKLINFDILFEIIYSYIEEFIRPKFTEGEVLILMKQHYLKRELLSKHEYYDQQIETINDFISDLISKIDITNDYISDIILKSRLQEKINNDFVSKIEITNDYIDDLIDKSKSQEKINNDLVSKIDITNDYISDLILKSRLQEKINIDLISKIETNNNLINDLIDKSKSQEKIINNIKDYPKNIIYYNILGVIFGSIIDMIIYYYFTV
jgi:hypothetical protein